MSKIEWTDKTWNPTTGCDKVSQGCKHCYAEIMHRRLRGMYPEKYSRPFLGNVETHPGELDKPKEWKKPCMVFVDSMSDLFHEDVDFNFIREVFQTMREADQHTYQVLTKRIHRVLEYIQWWNENYIIPHIWPPNVWLGVSCEDQANADERIPQLIKVPVAVRFLSCEPLLGPIDLTRIARFSCGAINAIHSHPITSPEKPFIDWVIVGGESGNKKSVRPMHPDWVRSLRDQCAAAGVPFFFKQWGEWVPVEDDAQPPFLYFPHNGDCVDGHLVNINDPEDPLGLPGKYEGHRFMDPMDAITYCLETKSEPCNFWKVGKSNSGNFLDGTHHLEFPATTLTTIQ